MTLIILALVIIGGYEASKKGVEDNGIDNWYKTK